MSHLSSLKLIAGKRQLGANPKEARRMKLCSKIDEQIRLAQGQQAGTPYQSVKLRVVQDPVTGERKTIEPKSGSYPVPGRVSGGLNSPITGAILSLM